MSRHLFGRGGDRSAAVAPTVALSLFALIGAGGIAFDYARMASLDTELQNAADQAALAGATQLDQELGAIERATAAAQGLVANETRMANDGVGAGITVPGVIFYETKDDAENNTNPIDTSDTNAYQDARFIRVQVAARRVDFALTPVVGAFTSGNLGAEAVAGLGSAICKTPPVMICNPNELASGDFDPDDYAGVGIKLVSVGGSGGSWAPGNFGYLDSAGGSNGATGLREDLGWVNPPGECQPTSGVDTKPGASVSVTGSLNTRFDIYDGNVDCQSGGECPASINSLKDVKRPANASGGNACRLHNNGWQLPTNYYGSGNYPPASATGPLPATDTPAAMGHPRDICHAVSTSGNCAAGEHVGDGVWDRDAYFRTNYVRGDGTAWTSAEWQTNTGLPADATRYQVYVWEIDHEGDVVDGVTVLGQYNPTATGNTLKRYGTPVCSPAEGYGTGQVPDDDTPDRRRISVAVINCIAHGVAGNSTGVPVAHWMEAFLVEPSLNRDRTGQGDVYIEVIQETDVGAGATAGQVIRRDVPYLVK